jgi:hypothetical protein
MKTRSYLPWFICLLICIVGWTARAQAPRGSAPRTTWDYKLILYNSAYHLAGSDFPAEMFEDGKALPQPVPGGLKKLKELGADGWELVTVKIEPLTGTNVAQFKYYLKRPD